MLKFKYVSQGNLKMQPSSADPITSRSSRLNQVFQVILCLSEMSWCHYLYICIDLNTGLKIASVTVSSWLSFPVFMYCPQGRVSLCGQQAACTLGREEFLEALLLLYQECTSPDLMKIHHVANFVNKCKHTFYTCVRCLCCLFFRANPVFSNHSSWMYLVQVLKGFWAVVLLLPFT